MILILSRINIPAFLFGLFSEFVWSGLSFSIEMFLLLRCLAIMSLLGSENVVRRRNRTIEPILDNPSQLDDVKGAVNEVVN